MTGFTWSRCRNGYFSRHRLSNGQFCMIGFFRHETNRAMSYYVAFAVADKKKSLNGWFDDSADNNITLKMTGRCGLEALCWCRDKLLEFECEVHRPSSKVTKIVVGGEDSRRFRMYERVLPKYGYRKVWDDCQWSMVKFLSPREE